MNHQPLTINETIDLKDDLSKFQIAELETQIKDCDPSVLFHPKVVSLKTLCEYLNDCIADNEDFDNSQRVEDSFLYGIDRD